MSRKTLSAASLLAAKRGLGRTFDVDRFVKRVAASGSDDYTDKATFSDGATFDGRLKVLRPEERPPDVSKERIAVRVTTPAGGVTFAARDRFKDSWNGVEYELLRPIGTLGPEAIEHEWYAVEVRS